MSDPNNLIFEAVAFAARADRVGLAEAPHAQGDTVR